MPSPEQPGSEPAREAEAYPDDYRAARYADEHDADAPYVQAQAALFATDLELSVFRFQLAQASYVLVRGSNASIAQENPVRSSISPNSVVSGLPSLVSH